MSIPASPHNLNEAQTLSEQALAWLASHSIPPSPVNYAVAYEFCAGTHPGLKAELDRLLATDTNVDAYLLRDLYESHFSADPARGLRGMGNDLQNILQQVIQNIAEAGEGASAYGATLERQISQLGTPQDPNDLRSIASELLSASHEAQSRNQELKRHLEDTRQETENLRTELAQHRRETQSDPLTGLYNRRGLDSRLGELMAEGTPPLSMLMIDIDHFKRINDTYGHAVGDVVIRSVADTLRKCIRDQDVAVRYGGEEFVVLLPDTTLDAATTMAESIRHRIEDLRLVRKTDNFSLAPFTISLGVATRKPADTRDSLFQRADQALYQSKASGRNRVTQETLLH